MPERRLAAGDHAPEFTLRDQHGEAVSLSDFRGRTVVLFVYPQAMTPACTTEACEFRDSTADFARAGIEVLGISPDDVDKLARFAERDGLDYPLLSDPEHAMLEPYGAWGEKQNYGRTYVGVIRSTFVVGPDGVLLHALYNVKATGHVGRVRKLLLPAA
ncbi:thioredoxin-dependent thiol peroxidase [Agromyces seonyuensis]|uniref:thioredoxin-dependent peroxiredoxin n=1 Tax=Agromyces seonyuensis TaxID=2662446 RepID=A0A6I4NZZ5_9MICO|nr:thioredoxin-dependent thiol peroxidase [Agromyces seonyuensis]MWB99943.1 thioredoxin-dependent thiol peroxidase [Agromyces seonyuensis]